MSERRFVLLFKVTTLIMHTYDASDILFILQTKYTIEPQFQRKGSGM